MIKEKLEAYRRQKRNEKIKDTLKNAMTKTFMWNHEAVEQPTMDDKIKLCELSEENVEDAATSTSLSMEDSSTSAIQNVSLNEDTLRSTTLINITYLLYAMLWFTLYVIALEFEFGIVYFVLSILVFICVNTRTRPKQQGEPSAYSVFNPNCEAIDGTLDASQFENEIRYGMGYSIR